MNEGIIEVNSPDMTMTKTYSLYDILSHHTPVALVGLMKAQRPYVVTASQGNNTISSGRTR